MRYSALARMLLDAGFAARQGRGDHEVWSKGPHRITITQTREISPGLVRKALKAIAASEED